MAIETVLSTSTGETVIDLSITYDGLIVTVGAGEFTHKRELKSLSEDFEVTLVPDATHDMSVLGILAWDTQAEECIVMVDEVLFDTIDQPFDFSASEQYDRIAWIFRTMLTPGQTSLDDGVFKIHPIRKYEEE